MNRMLLAEGLAARPDESGAAIALAGVEAVCEPSGALWLPEFSLLAVSDLHLEKGAAFARRRQFLPPYDTAATLGLLEMAVARRNPRIVLSLGDSFDDRVGSAHLPPPLRARLAALMRGRQWIWITGNHDPDGVEGLEGEVMAQALLGGLTFRHEPLVGVARGEVAGHLHPAAAVTRRQKTVRRPCFASDGERLLMPAFGVMTGGLDLRHRAFTGLFDKARLTAHLLNAGRIHSIPFTRLSG